MEQKLYEKFKESFVEMIVASMMLLLTSGAVLVISLVAFWGKRDPTAAMHEQSFWTMAFCICFFIGSLLWVVIMLLRYAHDRKVLVENKYEVHEGELAYMDICISGDEENYIPVMKDLKTGKKIRLDHRDPIKKNQTYTIYLLPKTKISVVERKFEEQ